MRTGVFSNRIVCVADDSWRRGRRSSREESDVPKYTSK